MNKVHTILVEDFEAAQKTLKFCSKDQRRDTAKSCGGRKRARAIPSLKLLMTTAAKRQEAQHSICAYALKHVRHTEYPLPWKYHATPTQEGSARP
ncbi:hypothetical protein VNO77_16723 [Canavalia gladiata]|uniref:Uncharacterized protein n=1 Tax=Canavalia gladiata TaxID=3824 RepID=A0AAN9LL62_CANGL